MKKVNIPVKANITGIPQEIALVESVQELVQNLTLENLQLLAGKSRKANINRKIQTYKNLI